MSLSWVRMYRLMVNLRHMVPHLFFLFFYPTSLQTLRRIQNCNPQRVKEHPIKTFLKRTVSVKIHVQ